MKRKATNCCIFLFFLLTLSSLQAEVSILSWNIRDFGDSKNQEEIIVISSIIKDFDIIAIQEVVTGVGGARKVALLSEILNRSGQKWDYAYSDPTSSPTGYTERYAYIWKTSKATLIGKPWLEKKFQEEITREPFLARFRVNEHDLLILNFHALPTRKQPEREIKFFKFLPKEYKNDIMFFVGDFNLPQEHTVFNPLKKMGYRPALIGQKTSLKKSINKKTYLSKQKDNIFFDTKKVKRIESGIIDFVLIMASIEEANSISDHLPVYWRGVFK